MTILARKPVKTKRQAVEAMPLLLADSYGCSSISALQDPYETVPRETIKAKGDRLERHFKNSNVSSNRSISNRVPLTVTVPQETNKAEGDRLGRHSRNSNPDVCTKCSIPESVTLTVTVPRETNKAEGGRLEKHFRDPNVCTERSVSDGATLTVPRENNKEEGERAKRHFRNSKVCPTRSISDGVALPTTGAGTMHYPDDTNCIKAGTSGNDVKGRSVVEQGQDGIMGTESEEGVEMSLSDFQKAAKFILLHRKDSVMRSATRKVRLALDGSAPRHAFGKSAVFKRRGRSVLLNAFRIKRKKSKNKRKDKHGRSPVVQGVKETTTNEMDNYVAANAGMREKLRLQANKVTETVIELYGSVLKAVTESYFLCHDAGLYAEEEAMDYIDTKYLQKIFGEGESEECESYKS